MIDDVQIIERPEPSAVSRDEANGMWTQLDAVRIAQQSATEDIADIKESIGGLKTSLADVVSDGKWTRALLFLLLLWQIGAAALRTAPAQIAIASVWP